MSTRRSQQICSVLQQAVQDVFSKGLQDPRIAGLITVTGVTLNPDLTVARVRISVLPHEKQALTMHGIRSATRHLQHEVASRVSLRKTPRLEFVTDESFKSQAGVLEALNKIKEEPPVPPLPTDPSLDQTEALEATSQEGTCDQS